MGPTVPVDIVPPVFVLGVGKKTVCNNVPVVKDSLVEGTEYCHLCYYSKKRDIILNADNGRNQICTNITIEDSTGENTDTVYVIMILIIILCSVKSAVYKLLLHSE